jgi:hypothetical protein
MSIPRKHHYLPQFYLENFKIQTQSGKKPHIWQIEKNGEQKHYNPAIENTGCIRDYHSLDYSEGSDHKTIETLLSRIESDQKAIVDAVCSEKEITSEQIRPLAEFTSLMRYRVPSFAKHIETQLKAIVLDTMKTLYFAGELERPPKELLDKFKTEGIDKTVKVDISNWKIISHMFQIGLSEESINLLARLSYQIYTTDESNVFITSDNPVALFYPDYKSIQPYGVGIAFKGAELTLPLSPKVLIRIGRDLPQGSFAATPKEVAEFNRRTMTMAEKYVFADRYENILLDQIKSVSNIFAGFTFDNLFHGDGSVFITRFIPVQ